MPRKYAAFGKMLKYYRELHNLKIHPPWSQVLIAKALGVSRRLYAGWENGESLPSPDDLRNIVTVLELSEEEEKTLYRSVAQVPPEIDNLPFKQNPFFTGRETELEQLRKQLQETGTAAITQPISITGLGGIGKTELALEFAHSSYPNVYCTALWVNAADESTLQASYEKLAETLGLPERNEHKLDRRIQAVKDWLKTHTNWLLIMDNADDLPLAESFLPAKPLGHVVFTTRSQIIDNIAANQIEIDKMELEDGLDFLLLRSHKLQVDADIRSAALEVVELLGGHPLALDQAGAYIQGTGVSFTDYVARYRIERRRLLNKRRSLKSKDSEHIRHPLPVAATLKLSIEDAGAQYPLATDILDFCAFLQPDAIPEELFQHDDIFNYGTTEFDDAIAALHSYSLIKRNTQEKTFSLHRLVQAVLIDNMSPDLQKQCRERVMQAVNSAFPVYQLQAVDRLLWLPNFKAEGRCKRLLPHALVCATWAEDESTWTTETANLFHKVATYVREHGQFPLAETLLLLALSIYSQHIGDECTHNTASALFELAFIYFALGMDSQAEPLFKEAIAIQEKLLEAEHRGAVRCTVSCLETLGCIYHRQEKYDQAELLYRQAIRIWGKNLGAEHRDIAFLLKGLVVLLDDQGQHEQAEALFLRSERLHGISVTPAGLLRLAIEVTKRNYKETKLCTRRVISGIDVFEMLSKSLQGKRRDIDVVAELLNVLLSMR